MSMSNALLYLTLIFDCKYQMPSCTIPWENPIRALSESTIWNLHVVVIVLFMPLTSPRL